MGPPVPPLRLKMSIVLFCRTLLKSDGKSDEDTEAVSHDLTFFFFFLTLQ